jgi:glutathione synthase/RimK-type ligase-like ATP-grasp enzyme
MRVALATSENWPELSPDDADLAGELRTLDVDAAPAIWSDASIDWSAFDTIVIRSCWDYHLRPDQFARWIDSLRVPVLNPPRIIGWNMHKSYLLDLASKGVRIPRTEIVRDVIVKPAISASAHNTHLMRGEVIVQEFVEEIVSDGEWSIVFFDCRFSHSVKKVPKAGDFRVQEELGGTSTAMPAPQHVIDAAARAVEAVEGDLLYARVDVVDRPQGVTLMELELIEPMLFLKYAPGLTARFASSIAKRLESRR